MSVLTGRARLGPRGAPLLVPGKMMHSSAGSHKPDETALKASFRGGVFMVGVPALVIFTWPLLLHPFSLMGHPNGETDNHFWMLWRAVKIIMGNPGPWANCPDGLPIPLMDQINLPWALPVFLLDPVLGYNWLLLANVALGMAGGYWLSRQFTSASAALVGMVAMGCSPFLSGVTEFGLTEAWPLWLLAFHLAFLYRYARSGGSVDLLGAGLCLGGFALSGWYHAFSGLLVEMVFIPVLAISSRRWKGLLAQGLLAAFLVLPVFLHFLTIRSFWAGRWHFPEHAPRLARMDWRELPVYGTDVLNFLLPTLDAVPLSKTTYLGILVLSLAVIACFRRWRQVWPFMLASLLFCSLALGYWVRVAGHPLLLGDSVLAGPARLLLDLVPPMVGISHWYRMVGPATVLLAVLAAMGAGILTERPGLHIGLAILVLADSLVMGQTSWPRITYDPAPPAIYQYLEEPGALLELPFDNGREPFSDTPARLYNRWQPFHGHPVAENYEAMDSILNTNRLAAVAQALSGQRSTLPRNQVASAEMADISRLYTEGVMEEQVEALAEDGFSYVLLHRFLAPDPDAVEALLRQAMGQPLADDGRSVLWRVPGGPATQNH